MIAAAKQKVAIYSRRPAYDPRATRPKSGDKPLIHGGVRNHHHHHQKNFILYSSSTNTGKSSCFSSTCPSISLSV
jgi:hypothetical protein